MRRFLPFAFGIVEIVALVMVAGWIGLGWALLLLLGTSVLGFALLRIEGLRAWTSLRAAAAEGRFDGDEAAAEQSTRMADAGVRVLSGVLLVVPGFVTDLVGLVLLIPPIRHSMGRRLSAAAFRTFPGRRPGGGPAAFGGSGTYGYGQPGQPGTGRSDGVQHGVVIEGEVVEPDTGRDPRESR
ncbi:FxsA family protein [Jiangella gansuensis]|uniref:FxsA family protein n=1 Tax=Jiangella gansuensis TaxID=281473 RepID=UPI0004ACB216|nr:FxsA family protein [Jiangella gansuensis]